MQVHHDPTHHPPVEAGVPRQRPVRAASSRGEISSNLLKIQFRGHGRRQAAIGPGSQPIAELPCDHETSTHCIPANKDRVHPHPDPGFCEHNIVDIRTHDAV